MNKKIMIGIIFVSVISLVLALDYYNIDSGTEDKIDEHDNCKYVSADDGMSAEGVFVPTKTSGEWSAFRDNNPTDTSLSSCCGDGETDSGEVCDGDSRTCEECCTQKECTDDGFCLDTQNCNEGTEDCKDDCSGYGECSATEPNCFDECQDDSDCGGPIK